MCINIDQKLEVTVCKTKTGMIGQYDLINQGWSPMEGDVQSSVVFFTRKLNY
jgi:hypothetical protein